MPGSQVHLRGQGHDPIGLVTSLRQDSWPAGPRRGVPRWLAVTTPALALTGERTLPGIWHENYWFRRHEAGYRWALDTLGAGVRVVVEAGVGEG